MADQSSRQNESRTTSQQELFPSRGLEKVVVRLPDGMREKLKNRAELNERSMNSEIVWRLEQSFAHDNDVAVKATDESIENVVLQLVSDAFKNSEEEASYRITKAMEKALESDKLAESIATSLLRLVGENNGNVRQMNRSIRHIKEQIKTLQEEENDNQKLDVNSGSEPSN